ncbi:MAG: adenylyltransferase/cytidyltransferase family protein [Candidatus Woesearchaeota archaeon]
MNTALFIGRFQPLHLGHLWVLRKILAKYKRVIIVIGSSKEKRTKRNPLSCKERIEMLRHCLDMYKKEYSGRYKIVPVPDFNKHEIWMSRILKLKFEVVYTGNLLNKKLFKNAGYKVVFLKRYRGISSRRIRRLIAEGRDVSKYLPCSTHNFLSQKGLLKVIRKCEECQ